MGNPVLKTGGIYSHSNINIALHGKLFLQMHIILFQWNCKISDFIKSIVRKFVLNRVLNIIRPKGVTVTHQQLVPETCTE